MLGRIAEDFNLSVSYSPKLFENFAGSGGHINFSTKDTRAEGGYDVILTILKRLEKTHDICLELYGDNTKRLTGAFETSNKDEFTFGAGNRAASIRIPTFTAHD